MEKPVQYRRFLAESVINGPYLTETPKRGRTISSPQTSRIQGTFYCPEFDMDGSQIFEVAFASAEEDIRPISIVFEQSVVVVRASIEHLSNRCIISGQDFGFLCRIDDGGKMYTLRFSSLAFKTLFRSIAATSARRKGFIDELYIKVVKIFAPNFSESEDFTGGIIDFITRETISIKAQSTEPHDGVNNEKERVLDGKQWKEICRGIHSVLLGVEIEVQIDSRSSDVLQCSLLDVALDKEVQ
ncbi:hypothetical protein HDU67_009990 [Dinochytrium kinnereticum]|nr:hypothetical protein HDU67_009990 [Dinochytrium kinnereticum]